jgi:hypothetical protein
MLEKRFDKAHFKVGRAAAARTGSSWEEMPCLAGELAREA